MTVTHTSSARSSGFPIIEKLGHQLLLAWTEIINDEEHTIVKTAIVDF